MNYWIIGHYDAHGLLGANAQCRYCPLMVSALPQLEHLSDDQCALDAGLMTGKPHCDGMSFSKSGLTGHEPVVGIAGLGWAYVAGRSGSSNLLRSLRLWEGVGHTEGLPQCNNLCIIPLVLYKESWKKNTCHCVWSYPLTFKRGKTQQNI